MAVVPKCLRLHCSEQGSAAVVNGLAIQQFLTLRRRKAGDPVHVLRRSQGFGPARAYLHPVKAKANGCQCHRAQPTWKLGPKSEIRLRYGARSDFRLRWREFRLGPKPRSSDRSRGAGLAFPNTSLRLGDFDDLAWAGVCGLGDAPGSLRRA